MSASDPAPVEVVVAPDTDDATLGRWRQHAKRHLPDVRVRRGVPADLDRPGGPAIVVEIDTATSRLGPPPWHWLPQLVAALERPGVDAVQPAPVDPDLLARGPVGAGLPVSVLERFDGRPLPDALPGAVARRAGSTSTPVLAALSWLVTDEVGLAPWPDWSLDPSPVPGTPSLRWSIEIAAPAAPLGRRWGDWHFARSLADALERLGQRVVIDHPQTRGRASAADDDVVLAIRGLEPVPPRPAARNLLWVISHPDDVGAAELAGFDIAFAASVPWARDHGVEPLLQCTDATRFHPHPTAHQVAEPEADGPLFVGNARGGPRPVVTAAVAAGVPVRVIGAGWEQVDGVEPAAVAIANTDLPAAYATASVVLGDHHDDMRRLGFCSNRLFDVLAVGGRLLLDDVAGLDDVLATLDAPPNAVRVWRTPADLARWCADPAGHWPDDEARQALAARVVADHSFDARAATLLAAALGSAG